MKFNRYADQCSKCECNADLVNQWYPEEEIQMEEECTLGCQCYGDYPCSFYERLKLPDELKATPSALNRAGWGGLE